MAISTPGVTRSYLVEPTITKVGLLGSVSDAGLGIPQTVRALTYSSSQILVDWSPVNNATSYEVEYSTDGVNWFPA